MVFLRFKLLFLIDDMSKIPKASQWRRGGEGRRGREGGRLGQLPLGGLGTYALLASVTVQYITGFIITVSLNSYRPYLRNLV